MYGKEVLSTDLGKINYVYTSLLCTFRCSKNHVYAPKECAILESATSANRPLVIRPPPTENPCIKLKKAQTVQLTLRKRRLYYEKAGVRTLRSRRLERTENASTQAVRSHNYLNPRKRGDYYLWKTCKYMKKIWEIRQKPGFKRISG